MEDRPTEEQAQGFLPPEPPGPEPDLGTERRPPAPPGGRAWGGGGQAAPPQPAPPGQPPYGHPPPPAQPPPGQWAPQGYAPLAPQQSYPAPASPGAAHGWSPPPPPGHHGPPAWQAPPPGQPAWGYPVAPPQPDNGSAVAGFVLSVVSAYLLLTSAGLSSIISIVCSGLGTFFSRRGKQRVDRGETPKHRGLAQAGFITGIVGLALAVIATLAWIAFFILLATDEGFRRELEDDDNQFSTVARAAVAGVAGLVRQLG